MRIEVSKISRRSIDVGTTRTLCNWHGTSTLHEEEGAQTQAVSRVPYFEVLNEEAEQRSHTWSMDS